MSRRRMIANSFAEEGRDLLRGAAGGLIFGTPILFTMEMWFHGMTYPPGHLLVVLVSVLALNTCFSFSSGLRHHNRTHDLKGALADAVTALGLGVMLAVTVLALIGQLRPADGLQSLVGRISLEAAAISVGIAFTNSRFPRRRDRTPGRGEAAYRQLAKAPLSREQKQARLDFHNLAAVLGGAAIFSFNVAATEEVVMIAAALSPPALLALLAAEGAVCYLILYAAQFKEKKVFKHTALQSPLSEVIMTMAAALLTAAGLLALMGDTAATLSLPIFVAAVVTLGFPAVVGGAAGKVVV